MTTEIDAIELERLCEEKITVGHDLIENLNEIKHIPGVAKIQKKILAEVSSLQNAIQLDRLTINHILCSNLVHFAYLVKVLKETENVQSVDFPIKSNGILKSSLRVDIVANGGDTWIKIIARNSKALNDIAFGRSNYGTKSILDHATCYIEAARDNLNCFRVPKVVFDFANQIDDGLEKSLGELGIVVRINNRSNDEAIVSNDTNNSKLNLDVTTMMAFVSNLTCESYNWNFNHPILNDQGRRESLASTKLFLDNLFEGKMLIACETAKNSFLTILNTVGGPNEKIRAKMLLDRIAILPDLSESEEDSVWFRKTLRLGRKVQERTYKIFAFGMYHKAVTATANKGAIESAKMQGVTIPVTIHEARALTEQKQETAQKLILN